MWAQAVYGRLPDLTREGGSIPVTLTFADSLGVNVLLLPMGRGDDGAQYVDDIVPCSGPLFDHCPPQFDE